MHRRVCLWDGKEREAHCWHLIVRREVNAPEEIKYTQQADNEGTDNGTEGAAEEKKSGEIQTAPQYRQVRGNCSDRRAMSVVPG